MTQRFFDRSRRLAECWKQVFRWGCLLHVIGLFTCSFIQAGNYSPEDIYRIVLPGVVTLEVETRSGEKHLGSAFLINREGVAATAWHLLQDARKVFARFSDQQAVEVVGFLDRNEAKDIALIRLHVSDRSFRPLCTNHPPVGERAYVIGSPHGYAFSISDGLISQMQLVDGFLQYQISCPISPGNSGGPVLNQRGEVLGVVCWSKKDAQNLSFATPAEWLSTLKSDAAIVPWSALPKSNAVKRASLAANLKSGQTLPVITSTEVNALREALLKSAGKEVNVTLSLDGEKRNFTVTLPPDFLK